MDGVSAVTARISEIRALVHPAPVVARTAAPSTTSAVPTAAHAFSAALTQASTGSAWPVTAPATTAVPAHLPVTGGVSAATSVAALKDRYSNGRIPAEALTSIGGGHRLAAPAAAGFGELVAAARRDGVEIGVTDSYRSFEAQVDVARRKGLYSQGGLAAQPGTSSHGWGLAVDLDLDPQALSWMRTHATRFGFVEDTPREPWHWAFHA